MSKLFVTAIAILVTIAIIPAKAQNESTQPGVQKKEQYLTNRFKDNWFMSFTVGGAVYYGNDDDKGDFGKRISPVGKISFGKWINPIVGVRVSGTAGKLYGFSTSPDIYTGHSATNGIYSQKWKFGNAQADVLFNLSAAIAGYNEKRIYELIPYVGAGYARSFENGTGLNAFTIDAGLLSRFRISKTWDINIDINAINMPKDFDAQPGGKFIEGYTSVTAGFTYRFRNRGFVRGVSYDELQMSLAEIENIKNRLKEQQETNANLEKELAYEKSKKPEKIIVENPDSKPASSIPPTIVFFEIGKTKISAKGKISLKFLAKEINENPDKLYTISGYADSATGSENYNKKLSRTRAENVFDLLVKYGVKPDRLALKALGGVKDLFDSKLEENNHVNMNPEHPQLEKEDEFSAPALNRVVIIE